MARLKEHGWEMNFDRCRNVMSASKVKGWILRLVKVVVVLLVLGGIGVYAMRDQIATKVLELAEARLAEEGLHIRHDAHELSWTRGVVLKGLSLYQDEAFESRLVWMENVGISVPLGSLFKDEPRMIFSSDRGSIKVETSAGDLEMSDLDFEVEASGESLELERFGAKINGLQIGLNGGLAWEQSDEKRDLEVPDLAPVVKAASWLSFSGGDPALALEVRPREGGVDVSGELTGEDFQWRGMAISRARVRLSMGDGRIEMPEVDLDCYGGNVKAAMAVDYREGKIEIEEIHSTAEPFRLVDAVMGKATVASFHAPGGAKVHGKDVVFDLKEFSRSRGVLTVDSPGGIVIPLNPAELPTTDFHGTVSFEDGHLVVAAQRFALHGGRGSGNFRMPLSGGYSYRLKLGLEGVSMKQMGKSLGLKKELAGTLNTGFEGGGGTGLKSHHGTGWMKVQDGSFYAIPLIGAFQVFVSAKVPQFGAEEAGDLNATFAVKNGVVSSSDFKVESSSTRVFAEGDVDLVANSIDVQVRMNLKGVVGVATSLVSHAFKVTGEGPFDDVRWSMSAIPDGLEDATNKVTDAVKGTAEGVGDAAKEVGEAAGKLLKNRPGFLVPKKEED